MPQGDTKGIPGQSDQHTGEADHGLGCLATGWVISVLAALVSGAVAHFPSVAVFLPPVALVCGMLDARWRQQAKEQVFQQQQ